MDHVNTAIAISFGLGSPAEDAAARAMMQKMPAYTPRTPAAVASTDPARASAVASVAGDRGTPHAAAGTVDRNAATAGTQGSPKSF